MIKFSANANAIRLSFLIRECWRTARIGVMRVTSRNSNAYRPFASITNSKFDGRNVRRRFTRILWHVKYFAALRELTDTKTVRGISINGATSGVCCKRRVSRSARCVYARSPALSFTRLDSCKQAAARAAPCVAILSPRNVLGVSRENARHFA